MVFKCLISNLKSNFLTDFFTFKEFILTFKEQLLKKPRQEKLRSILDKLNITDYTIIEKNKILDGLPSDFDVIKVI
jgi:hypothetical protein